MTFIIVYGSIFDKIRPAKHKGFFGKLLNCPLCTGFHSGWFIYILFWISDVKLWNHFEIGLFLFGCLSAGTSYILSSLVSDDGFSVSIKK